MTKILLVVLCSAMSMGLFAQDNATTSQSDHQRTASNVSEANKKYTFGDFFDALDLPTVLGAGITPNGIEGATFNSAMRLGWRHHKNYGTFVYISPTIRIATPMIRSKWMVAISAMEKYGTTRWV